MGLFQTKKPAKKQPTAEERAAAEAQQVFTDAYLEELRAAGRQYFHKVLEENTTRFKQEIDDTIAHVSIDLKEYLSAKLDDVSSHINDELAAKLEERLQKYDQIVGDAQDQAVQSLNRNAQAVHEKYDQLAQTLQQTVSGQEAMMIGVFEENKARMMKTEERQDQALTDINTAAGDVEKRVEAIAAAFQKTVDQQQTTLKAIIDEGNTKVATAKGAQDAALAALTASAAALQKQHDELAATLEKIVADQKEMITSTFTDHMADVIEYYLKSTLGDKFDLKAQVPAIIKELEENKQAIVEDMTL
ncbi:MAG TPA: hypothetical protein VFQ70_03225 [Candidatus Saccharimonadaceae bacterium]|nr:hypothetical protein [Candidatus Saccharimonadaceae bacterium]